VLKHWLFAVIAVMGSLGATAAAADCTLDKIKTCTFSDPAQAEQVLLRAVAHDGTPRLLGQIAEFYRTAPGSYHDQTNFIWYLGRAADAGDQISMIAFADLMIRGDGVARDPDAGVKLLIRASELGSAPALTALGKYYLSIGDRQHALEALLDAADHDDPAALDVLASLEPDKHPAAPTVARAPVVIPPKPTASPNRVGSKPDAASGSCLEAPPAAIVALQASIRAPSLPPRPLFRPPSTYAGQELTLLQVLNFAYSAGFKTTDSLVGAAALAIAESGLWTQARNWKPELGYRDASDVIGVKGPPEAWSPNGRQQLHSDRGLWQLSSLWWPAPDSVVDDPAAAAVIVFGISRGGCDFSLWSSFTSGSAQKHFDEAFDGWPALRPVVKDFLDKKERANATVSR
jgi:hypothetical protein